MKKKWRKSVFKLKEELTKELKKRHPNQEKIVNLKQIIDEESKKNKKFLEELSKSPLCRLSLAREIMKGREKELIINRDTVKWNVNIGFILETIQEILSITHKHKSVEEVKEKIKEYERGF